jgi:hypothetical protein
MALDINRPEGKAPDPEGLKPPERRFVEALLRPRQNPMRVFLEDDFVVRVDRWEHGGWAVPQSLRQQ